MYFYVYFEFAKFLRKITVGLKALGSHTVFLKLRKCIILIEDFLINLVIFKIIYRLNISSLLIKPIRMLS